MKEQDSHYDIAVFINLRYKDPPQSPFKRGEWRSHTFAICYIVQPSLLNNSEREALNEVRTFVGSPSPWCWALYFSCCP